MNRWRSIRARDRNAAERDGSYVCQTEAVTVSPCIVSAVRPVWLIAFF